VKTFKPVRCHGGNIEVGQVLYNTDYKTVVLVTRTQPDDIFSDDVMFDCFDFNAGDFDYWWVDAAPLRANPRSWYIVGPRSSGETK